MLVGPRTKEARAPLRRVPSKTRRVALGLGLGVAVTALAAVAAAGVLRPEVTGGFGSFGSGALTDVIVVYDVEQQQINVLFELGNQGRRAFHVADVIVPAALGSLKAFEATPEAGEVTGYRFPGASPIEPPVAVDFQPGHSAMLYFWFEPENCLDALARVVDIELQLEISSGTALGGRSVNVRELAAPYTSQHRFQLEEVSGIGGETPCESYDMARGERT